MEKVSEIKKNCSIYCEFCDICKQGDFTSLESTLEYVPHSLRDMLQHLLVGKDTQRKEASIAHAIIQAVRPRKLIAPL